MKGSEKRFIAFSGIDSAGKTTQINLLLELLKRQGEKPVYLWTRGGYTYSLNILKIFLRRIMGRKLPPPGKSEKRDHVFRKVWIRNLWLCLAILDLMLVYGIYVRIVRILGRIVVADRYILDTWIDFRLNFPEAEVEQWFLWEFLIWLTPEPDAAFLLLIPVEESLRRSIDKNEPFPDPDKVRRKRIALYIELSSQKKMRTLDCMQPIENIHQEIRDVIGF